MRPYIESAKCLKLKCAVWQVLCIKIYQHNESAKTEKKFRSTIPSVGNYRLDYPIKIFISIVHVSFFVRMIFILGKETVCFHVFFYSFFHPLLLDTLFFQAAVFFVLFSATTDVTFSLPSFPFTLLCRCAYKYTVVHTCSLCSPRTIITGEAH